jgi:hypothetical protein
MTGHELQSRFLDEIDQRGRADKYIDGLEERELMQIGIQHGFDTQAARGFLVQACESRGYVIEAAIVGRIRTALRQEAGRDGRLSRRGYERVVAAIRRELVSTTRSETEIRRLVLTTLLDDGKPTPRPGWLGPWIDRARRHAGL